MLLLTAANWASENPVLGRDECGLEADTGLMKFGNGVAHWNDLPYSGTGRKIINLPATPNPAIVKALAGESGTTYLGAGVNDANLWLPPAVPGLEYTFMATGSGGVIVPVLDGTDLLRDMTGATHNNTEPRQGSWFTRIVCVEKGIWQMIGNVGGGL